MQPYEEKSYQIFDLFRNQWALVTAGDMAHHNACTLSWGSMGTLWHVGSVLTVYVHPGRYTCDFLKSSDTFTVSFFPPEKKAALSYMGSHSGRDGDKDAPAGLTPVPMGESVTYQEASVTFLCRKICQQTFDREGLSPDVQALYKDHPGVYPPDENGDWQPHWMFIGQVLEVRENA